MTEQQRKANAEGLRTYVARLIKSKTLAESWAVVCETLADIGFDRILYGRKILPSAANLHNLSNTILLSTYGPVLDEQFLKSRMYMQSPTVRWLLTDYGVMSWGETTRRYEAGELPDEQVQVYLRSRELGLTAGLTYSIPRHSDAFRSGFGLVAPIGCSQSDCDKLWARNEDDLVQIMSIFDLAVGHFPRIPDGQQLDEKTISFMRLVAEGRSMNEIADLNGCHFRTVDNRLAKARELLGAANTLQAVLIAKEQGQF